MALAGGGYDEGGPGTVVGSNVKLVGTIQDTNNINIHGSIEGEVVSEKSIEIAEGAKVKGPVTGNTVKVSGRVDGSIVAKDRLEITPTGKVTGSINTKDLVINSGAVFVGKCTMGGQDAKAADKAIEEANEAVEESDKKE